MTTRGGGGESAWRTIATPASPSSNVLRRIAISRAQSHTLIAGPSCCAVRIDLNVFAPAGVPSPTTTRVGTAPSPVPQPTDHMPTYEPRTVDAASARLQ